MTSATITLCQCKSTACGIAPEDHRHGTANGYCNWSCRCAECTEAHTRYLYDRKKARPPLAATDRRHGTANGYGNYDCRCRPCTKAWALDARIRARR